MKLRRTREATTIAFAQTRRLEADWVKADLES